MNYEVTLLVSLNSGYLSCGLSVCVTFSEIFFQQDEFQGCAQFKHYFKSVPNMLFPRMDLARATWKGQEKVMDH